MISSILLSLLLLVLPQEAEVLLHMSTSGLIDYARMIARDQGFDVRDTGVYTFDLIPRSLVPGYTQVDFRINASAGSLIMLNNSTGQAIDFNSCEVFDYPDMKVIQDSILRIGKVSRKTPQELAHDVGCSAPKVLTKPVPVRKRR